ncbi:MAG: Jag N-terminal domain-containing protein [Candidatus Omnitrophota bacterium]
MTPQITREFEGKTVEEAIDKALQELRLPLERLKIEVLSEEEKGLFGMSGAKLAKVRITVIKSREKT